MIDLNIQPIKTDRLILRTPQESDFDAAAAFNTSDRTTYVGGKITQEWDQWRGFMGSIGHWVLRGYGFFTVTLHDGTRVGRVGVINHRMWPEPELGWHLYDGFEGCGYATEAARAARTWAHTEHGLGPLISQIHPDNHASAAVAKRLGATLEAESTLLGDPCHIYRHPAPAQVTT
ncbi:GNAT family N-acetyltransferase [Puniceibacterium sediminis]|uniref:Protein N-acetyltransferase, RimJ/RimL family n=1 Tax=Puniceibacterium sediminis TaxID=1608407 RepID=A0A238Y692_9RHOB|nr:GNAT family N-acetyltransferase [Puniceibacterium sediminis]SNR65859.1 Protein N-acetyltransferase, RimJ/RimL family [Puniceibacterium sediminis]